MAFGINLGGSRERSTTTGTQSTTATESFERGTFDTTETLELLDSLLADFNLETLQSQSAERAREQATGAVDNLFREYQESILPQITGQQAGAGAHSSTAGQLMANDAFARTVAQAAELELGLSQQMTDQGLRGREQNLNQFAQLLQANLQQTGRSRREEESEMEQRTRGRGSNWQMGFQGDGEDIAGFLR